MGKKTVTYLSSSKQLYKQVKKAVTEQYCFAAVGRQIIRTSTNVTGILNFLSNSPGFQ
jgi:hypothetical protein